MFKKTMGISRRKIRYVVISFTQIKNYEVDLGFDDVAENNDRE